MKLAIEIDLPDNRDARADGMLAARRLLNDLIQAQYRATNDMRPGDSQTPIRLPGGSYAGFWQVTP